MRERDWIFGGMVAIALLANPPPSHSTSISDSHCARPVVEPRFYGQIL